MPGALWTDEHTEMFCNLYAQLRKRGYYGQEIINKLMEAFPGRSQYSIRDKLRDLKLSVARPAPEPDFDIYRKMMEIEDG